jgi:hypothetical protein
MCFPLIFEGKNIRQAKKKFCRFLIKSPKKKKNKRKYFFFFQKDLIQNTQIKKFYSN